ncbi:uncharacterized protein LOC117810408 [Xyrichtys novacula]|uniref:Uncharacterized protein LOC117810408 n=1 Tax=Xyrichtys novacula TaxID=13765 RepID=A0AAV1GF22_XYRNO|nr:uncharacterized protein LOC117810408 [Xyrichtys novacula]
MFIFLLKLLNPKQQHSAPTVTPPKKRKRTSVAHPAGAPEHPLVPRSLSPISPEELPPASSVAPVPLLSTFPVQPDTELKIHNRSVEEYQLLYHRVVDDMLNFKDGRARPFSFKRGRLIKQKLWEQLDRPSFTESVDEDGLVHVDVSYGKRFNPPHYYIDTSDEPQPETPRVSANCVGTVDLQDQASGDRQRASARLAGKKGQQRVHRGCPCCGSEQQQHSAPTVTPPKKRKRTSVAHPPGAPEHPLVPRSLSPISPEELPPASSVAPVPRLSTPPVQPDTELKIHNRSVEEYQLLYHRVVDDMLNFENGRARPFSFKRGRLIKQKLWEQLDRPSFTEWCTDSCRSYLHLHKPLESPLKTVAPACSLSLLLQFKPPPADPDRELHRPPVSESSCLNPCPLPKSFAEFTAKQASNFSPAAAASNRRV